MIWFTSDQHYGHANVIKYCNRPFSSVEEMNEEMVRRHNVLVKPGDTTYHLGDFALSKSLVPLYLPRLNGEHILIMGNHDHCHPALTKRKPVKTQNAMDFYRAAGFQWIAESSYAEIAGIKVLMHHMPYQGDHEAERYTEFRPVDNEGWLLHGHVHDSWKVKGKMINVGVDQWSFAPVSILELKDIIENSIE